MNWLIYGAYGYTGELIAREAVRRGLRPILGGRDAARLAPLAAELQLEYRAVGLDDPLRLAESLRGVDLVLHCAGPFSATAKPMIEACLHAHAHYLDITGEIGVFEYAQAQHARAVQAGIVICPGVGFDVIPTDCVAALLKSALPDATHLALGFDSRSGLSPGTAKTSLEGLAQGGMVREDGLLRPVPLAWHVREIDFGDGRKTAMTIPWGDVATAYYTTGIPNIEVYIAAPPALIRNARRANLLRRLLGIKLLQNALKRRIAKRVKGPDAATRARLSTYVWGEIRNAAGAVRTARVKTANGYALTIKGALAVVDFLSQQPMAGGAYTPSRLCGADLVSRLPGSGAVQLT